MSRPFEVCDLTTLFIDTDGGGGVNTYLEAKARDFARRPDVAHTIIVPGARDELVDDWLGAGARLYKIASRRLAWNPEHRVLFRLREVRRILRAARPDVVEVDCAFWFSRTAARALAETRVPVVGAYHVHLPAIARSGPRLGRLVSGLFAGGAWRYTRYCIGACDRIVVTSTAMRERLEKRGLDNLEFVPLGVDTDLFRPDRVAERRLREGRPAIERRLLYVGRLSAEKELDVLLRAFDELPGGTTLDIVGDGPLRKRIARVAAKKPRIRLRGACPHGPALLDHYRAADAFVMPSSHETFGLATLEAAACGVPVVAADGGGSRDTVTPDVGLRVPPGDPAALACGIRQVLARRDAGAFAGGPDHVARTWSWDRCFSRLLDVYEDAAGAGVGAARPRHAHGAQSAPMRRVR